MNNLDESDRNWLRKMLLTPIRCEGIKVLEMNVISSSGKRYETVDEDMSDLAIAFYETLYGKTMLESVESVDSKKHFCCDDFAGDTMNSYKSVANQFFGGNPKRCAKRKEAEKTGKFLPGFKNILTATTAWQIFGLSPKQLAVRGAIRVTVMILPSPI